MYFYNSTTGVSDLGNNPSFQKYKASLGLRKNNVIFSSTQPKELPCAFLWDFPETARKQNFHLDMTNRSREIEKTEKQANGQHI